MTGSIPNLEQLAAWMAGVEDEHLEFKEAKNQYDSEKLTKYCVALANEGGGHVVLGVSDKRPRTIVGTGAYRDLSGLKQKQSQRVGLHIDAVALDHPDGRVVVITVPARPIGRPIEYEGSYWMRRGEDLVAMSAEVLKTIFDEAQPDYSALRCPGATMADLDEAAIERLRALWLRYSENGALATISPYQILEDAELCLDGRPTYAALVMVGTSQGVARHLAHAETIFEYRSSEGSIPYQERREFRKGFLLYLDELWELVNLRNEVHSYKEGLFRREIATFNQQAVREALLNALAHRDYRVGGSVFIRQFPKKLEIVSPGGFPPGITLENLLRRQAPRNRRVAEVMAKCGLVERSGQGANLMFEACIQESKALPDFKDTDAHQVSLILRGEVQDESFLSFLERVGQETLAHFTTEDFLLIDAVHRQVPIAPSLVERAAGLIRHGVIESKGRGRGTNYLLSERFYKFTGQRGTYTRVKGLDRDTNKALLLKHLERNLTDGSPLRELQQVLPALSDKQVQRLLVELREEGEVHVRGKTRGARWYAGPFQKDAS